MIRYRTNQHHQGFTIVELLVVIVVIAVLAAITIVSYTGITNRANVAVIQSDLTNASKQLGIFNATNGYYPLTNNCGAAESSTNICLKLSDDYTYTYAPNNATNPTGYTLSTAYNNSGYRVANNSAVSTIANLAQPTSCPSGFIPVPGSPTYGTSGFCIMKYEAKHYNGSTTIPVSTANNTPWVNIAQSLTGTNNDAMEISQNAVDQSGNPITGAHLVTEAEWMTVAQNVLSVASNWSNSVVGSGYVYRGHNDGVPPNSLAASTDNDGYFGTGQTTGDQKRTLTLTNGEVIWDLAGNVWEWTAGQTSGVGNQPGITGAGLGWRQWTAITNPGNLTPSTSPAGTGISGSNNWDYGTGVGLVSSDSDQASLRGFIRSGGWGSGWNAGVLSLRFDYSPTEAAYGYISFRVAR